MQMMQMDPRFMDCFKELTGIDLMAMGEERAKTEESRKEADAKLAEVRAQKEKEEEAKRKAQAEA